MMDFQSAKYAVKLLDLVPNMRYVASTGGGEYAGPCPYCGGVDRFRIQAQSNRWYCRQCGDGHWHDVFDFVMKRDQCSLVEAAKRLNVPAQVQWTANRMKEVKRYGPPDQAWQEMAGEVIDRCRQLLFSKAGERGLDYLLSRGLASPTIEKFHLGYSPAMWVGKVKIPQGITIPASYAGVYWYIKIRSIPGTDSPRYLCIPGSKTNAIFHGDAVNGWPFAMISEGEFNAMILDQEVGDVIPVCSLGSAVNKLDLLTWGKCFLSQRYLLCLYDNDPAGEKGFENMKEMLGKRAKRVTLPGERDLNDYFLAGGDIWEWLSEAWNQVDPLPDQGGGNDE